MNWKFFANLGVGFLESAGIAKVDEDENEIGLDDLIGQALLFSVKLARFALSGGKGSVPKAPDAFR